MPVTYTSSYYLCDGSSQTFIGKSEELIKVPTSYPLPASLAWFCPSCGNVWAETMTYIKGMEVGRPSRWNTYIRKCQSCSLDDNFHHPEFIGGSFLQSCIKNELDLMDENLVRREFNLLLTLYETNLEKGIVK